jgi:hypothetical protein
MGSNSSIRLLGQIGRYSSVSLSQAEGSIPFSFAVPISDWITAARLPARSDPLKSQFLRPSAIGRIADPIGLLSMGRNPL